MEISGIYIAAIITMITSLLLAGSLAFFKTPRSLRHYAVLALLMTLPLQPLAFYLVRMPIHRLLGGIIDIKSGGYLFFSTFYAPLTEEPAKLIPLLFPFLRRIITRENFVPFAMMLGLGFGIGEMWMVAEQVTRVPAYAILPFYDFSGYFGERIIVCFMHGAFTAMALRFLHGKFYWGILGAMFLHYLGNFPIYLGAIDLFNLGKTNWQGIVSVWIIVYFLVVMAIMGRISLRKITLGEFFNGKAKCPECGQIYPRPLFLALNLVNRRYERCPFCHKWHMTDRYKEEVPDPAIVPATDNKDK